MTDKLRYGRKLLRPHWAQIHVAVFFFLVSLFVTMPPWAGRGLFLEQLWPSIFAITAGAVMSTVFVPLSRILHVIASALVGMCGMFQIITTLMDGTSSIHLAFSVLWSLLVLIAFRWDDLATCASASRILEEGKDYGGD